ncbi:hypothetical protein M0805_002437 [Coniferiporia weirii]|nr:hypothetical protein M0805_002437 [Coniferiporia weirii]
MSLLHLLSYVGILTAAGFVVLSLASGLLWISELIEEHSRTAKVVGTRAVYVIIVLHVLLYFTDALPLSQTLFSIVCHFVYLQNFAHTWPYIALASPAFVASCVLAIVNHFLWFFYFSRRSRDARAYAHRFRGAGAGGSSGELLGFVDTATFFALCVWFVPLFLFLSLSANDNALPVSSDGALNSPTTYAASQPITTSRSSLFKSILDFFPRIRRRRDSAEGIIVSHTPTPSAPSTPRASVSGEGFFSSPRASLDGMYTGNHNEPGSRSRIALRPPPKRAVTGPGTPTAAKKFDDETAVVGSNYLLSASRSVSDEVPMRRRTLVE